MLKCKIIVCFLLLSVLSIPVHAADTDPGGVQLKKALEDRLANAPEDDAEARKLKSMGGVAALDGANNAGNVLACTLEIATLVGAVIWNARSKGDACNAGRYERIYTDPYYYCLEYSNHCGHWVWEPDCLKSYDCPNEK